MTQQEVLDLIEETTKPYNKGQLMSRQVAVDFIKDIRDSLNVMIEVLEMEIEDKKSAKTLKSRAMNWQEKILRQCSNLASENVKYKDFPKWLKFKLRLMTFLWDTVYWDQIKKGWPMWRMKYRQWKFYRNHPYLKSKY